MTRNEIAQYACRNTKFYHEKYRDLSKNVHGMIYQLFISMRWFMQGYQLFHQNIFP